MLTATQVLALTGTTYRRLDYWLRLDVVETCNVGGNEPGSGAQRLFSIDELFVIAAVADLSDLRVGTDQLKRVAAQLRQTQDPHGTIYVDRDGFFLSGPAGSCYCVDLDLIRERLDEAAATVA